MIHFADRRDAGTLLATRLAAYRGNENVIVLGIPRGGVVVAAQIARALETPLDVWLTHKLGAPFNPELALGAIARDGSVFIDYPLLAELGLKASALDAVRERELLELVRREELYRQARGPLDLKNKVVILVDDGIATGSTTIAALRALRNYEPERSVLAAPVAPCMVAPILSRECDELVLLATPDPFLAVGRFYADFSQVSDEEVIALLTGPPEES